MPSDCSIDLDLVAQRILKLAEIAMLEHLEALTQSQAQRLMELHDADTDAA